MIGHPRLEFGASLLKMHHFYSTCVLSLNKNAEPHVLLILYSADHRKQCMTLIPQLANMPRINVVAPDRVQSTVAFSIKCPNVIIPQRMRELDESAE